ncbi:ferrous iron transport protein B [Paenibacillus sp. KN14-4R]|uniref:ferrous iron transport protein B n=1 Tax=Paenibacillus sp. KN14-4R TaxID=3445773 RepID=UPI003FA0D7F3
MLTVALVGNPNTGKTSLFNTLTGSYEYIGNWPGVTVEKKVGVLKAKKGSLIDLPGVYSLNPLSKDEGITSQFLLDEPFSTILNVVDASQLARNLQLTIQLLELGKPMIVALNMVDVAANRGLTIDVEALQSALQIPVLPVVARLGKGCSEIFECLSDQNDSAPPSSFQLHYGILEQDITQIVDQLPDSVRNKRWMALQFLEGNEIVKNALEAYIETTILQQSVEQAANRIIDNHEAKSLPQFIRNVRSQYIESLLKQCTTKTKPKRSLRSEQIDTIVTNKFLGIPIFILFMFLTFKLTFEWIGQPLSDLLDTFFNGPLKDGIAAGLTAIGASSFIHSLVLDGILAGVGGVLVFIPQIFMLFLIISFIEDSGYMARIATVMDKLMELIGLNGKAFIPMIIGFGCNVPGIMAARTIEQPKERLLTVILTPLMSCSARLSVYSLFVGVFFKEHQALIVLSLYLLGIVVALVLAKLFSMTILKQEQSMFVVELPPYRIPQWRTLFRSTWEKGKGFVKKAGTFIFGGSVVIWLLSYAGPGGLNVDMNDSFLAIIGGWIAPLFSPIGFGTWQAGAALITGFLAKEVVVSTMNIIYLAPDTEALQGVLAGHFTQLEAYSFIAFILLYIPCLATVGVIRKETGSLKWTWFSIIYALIVAYLISLIIVGVGHLLGM